VHNAEKALSALCIEPSIIYACVRDKKNKVFTSYNRDAGDKSLHLLEINKDGYGFGGTSLNVLEHITLEGEKIGIVQIRSDLNPMYITLKRNAGIVIAVLFLASFIAYLVSSRLQTIISGPILSLAMTAKEISKNKDYSTRVPKYSKDEVGLLSGAFNTMLEQIQNRDLALVNAKEQLEIRVKERTSELTAANKLLRGEVSERKQAEEKLKDTHKALMEASRQAGMTQVATDVLHNVGNVLNSVNVSTTLITEKLSQSKLPNLKKLADIIKDHTEDLGEFLTKDPQGKSIPAYLIKIAKLLTDEQADVAGKIDSLAGNIDHIKEIINMQQSYSRISGIEIPTSLNEVIENSININSSGLDKYGIQLICDFAELPEVYIDKQKMLQILVNLVANAKYALIHSEKEEKLLTVRFYQHGEDCLRVEISDNGMGIPKEDLTKIFRHGFTTKKHGNGFGLHSGALAAKEMGGLLSVHSDGVGQGATFTLELPFKPVEVMITT
jgi:signal transduction histidine kinase